MSGHDDCFWALSGEIFKGGSEKVRHSHRRKWTCVNGSAELTPHDGTTHSGRVLAPGGRASGGDLGFLCHRTSRLFGVGFGVLFPFLSHRLFSGRQCYFPLIFAEMFIFK